MKKSKELKLRDHGTRCTCLKCSAKPKKTSLSFKFLDLPFNLVTNWLMLITMPVWGGILLLVVMIVDGVRGRGDMRKIKAGKKNFIGNIFSDGVIE